MEVETWVLEDVFSLQGDHLKISMIMGGRVEMVEIILISDT